LQFQPLLLWNPNFRQLQTSKHRRTCRRNSISTLVDAVIEAELTTALSDRDATLTVFAPNNAFDALY
jgi:uncharacterized surface protein with fasciclin (FAS1) repeats